MQFLKNLDREEPRPLFPSRNSFHTFPISSQRNKGQSNGPNYQTKYQVPGKLSGLIRELRDYMWCEGVTVQLGTRCADRYQMAAHQMAGLHSPRPPPAPAPAPPHARTTLMAQNNKTQYRCFNKVIATECSSMVQFCVSLPLAIMVLQQASLSVQISRLNLISKLSFYRVVACQPCEDLPSSSLFL